MGQEEIMQIFKSTGALLSGHFKLTSGLHSGLYFQCALVLQHPKHAHVLSQLIVNNFKTNKIDTVISPAIGGIVVGQEVGRLLGVKTIFVERENGIMKLRRGFALKKNERVLICEDVVTTGGSVFEVIDLVKKNKAIPVGVGFIVDRSNGKVNFNIPQYSCVHLDVQSFKPENCPLCKSGIPIEKPGSRN